MKRSEPSPPRSGFVVVMTRATEEATRMAKYTDWLTKENLIVVQSWAIEGATDEQVAKNIGIAKTTLYEWKKKYPEFAAALKKGKAVVDALVENALLKAAMAGESWAVCFWLKNRRPDKWRDKPDTESNTNLTIVIKDEYGDEDDGG